MLGSSSETNGMLWWRAAYPWAELPEVEEGRGKLETQSDSEYDSDPDIKESIIAWIEKQFSLEDPLDCTLWWHLCNCSLFPAKASDWKGFLQPFVAKKIKQ